MKLDRGDYVGDITPHANFGISTPKWAVLHMHEIDKTSCRVDQFCSTCDTVGYVRNLNCKY